MSWIIYLGFLLATFAFSADSEVSASAFGCQANRTFDNTACLAALNTNLKANDGSTVFFPAGIYRYTNNTWLQGVRNVHVVAHGVTFQNVNASNWYIDAVALAVNCDYWTGKGGAGSPNNCSPNRNSEPGRLIQTANAGARSIELRIPGDSSQFSAGDYVLIAGYDQQGGGYPPNLRYNEIHKIASVNSSTGVISLLDAPLKFSYDSRWYNTVLSGTPINMGAPVAIALRRTSGTAQFTLAEHIIIDGATFASNPSGIDSGSPPLGSVVTAGVLKFECNFCTIGNLDVSEDQSATFNDSYIYRVEPDKIVDTLVFNRCVIGSLSQATGIRNLVVRDSTLLTYFQAASRNVGIYSSQIFASSPSGYGAMVAASSGGTLWTPTYQVSLIGNQFVQGPGRPLALLAGTQLPSLTVLTAPTSSSVTAAVDFAHILPVLDIGSTMFTSGRAKVGTVTAIYGNGTNITVEGKFSAPPAPGDVFYYPSTWAASILSNSLSNQGSNLVQDVEFNASNMSINSDFNRTSATDPGCGPGKGYAGKMWVDIGDPKKTEYRVCQSISGSLAWVAK
jgi:hypothetical protein